MDRVRIDTGNVEAREIEGELVLLDLKSQTYLGGNRSAAALWPRLVNGASRDELTESLREEFGVDVATAREDVDALVSQLQELDLLVAHAD